MRYLTFGEWKKTMIPVEPDCNILASLHYGDGTVECRKLSFNKDVVCKYDSWLVTKAVYSKHDGIGIILAPSVQVERRWRKSMRNLSELKRDINYTTILLATNRFVGGF